MIEDQRDQPVTNAVKRQETKKLFADPDNAKGAEESSVEYASKIGMA